MARQQLNNLDFGNSARPINVPDPVNAGDGANKGYVDRAVEGLAWKDNARVATQANINLAAPGATIDTVTMAIGDRFLARVQTTASQSGLYIWNGAATPATRALDASTYDELENAVVTIDEGTSAGTSYRQTGVNGTIDSTAVTWGNFGTTAPAASETVAGLAEAATQGETDAAADDQRFVTPLKLGNWSGRLKRHAATIGDNSATQFTVTHNFNTQDVTVAVYRNSGAYDEVNVDVEHTTVNSVTIRFIAAPTSNAYRVVVHA